MHSTSLALKENSDVVEKLKTLINDNVIVWWLLNSVIVSASPISEYVALNDDIEALLNTHLTPVAESADKAAVMKQKIWIW